MTLAPVTMPRDANAASSFHLKGIFPPPRVREANVRAEVAGPQAREGGRRAALETGGTVRYPQVREMSIEMTSASFMLCLPKC